MGTISWEWKRLGTVRVIPAHLQLYMMLRGGGSDRIQRQANDVPMVTTTRTQLLASHPSSDDRGTEWCNFEHAVERE